jgi:hypothetical protein
MVTQASLPPHDGFAVQSLKVSNPRQISRFQQRIMRPRITRMAPINEGVILLIESQAPNPNFQIQANHNHQKSKAAEPRISRITRIWNNCSPNISAIRVIRGQSLLGFGIC